MRASRLHAAGIIWMLSWALTAGADAAATMVGVGPGGFYRIDPVTGTCSLVGRLHPDTSMFQQPHAMAVRPSDGKIFVWNNVHYGLLNYSLSTIDPDTGRATVLQQYYDAVPMRALSFGPDGALYGQGDRFYRFDSATWAVTDLGPRSISLNGMDLGPDGRLYGLVGDVLASINPANGSVISKITLSQIIDYTTSLAFSPDGKLYGVSSSLLGNTIFYDINPVTGEVSSLGQSSVVIYGVGFVPEPSTFALCFCALGAVQCRRRRAAGLAAS